MSERSNSNNHRSVSANERSDVHGSGFRWFVSRVFGRKSDRPPPPRDEVYDEYVKALTDKYDRDSAERHAQGEARRQAAREEVDKKRDRTSEMQRQFWAEAAERKKLAETRRQLEAQQSREERDKRLRAKIDELRSGIPRNADENNQ